MYNRDFTKTWVKKGTRPTEVGALTVVFEKSATKLKLKQKLQKSRAQYK